MTIPDLYFSIEAYLDSVLTNSDLIGIGEMYHGSHSLIFSEISQFLSSFTHCFIELPINLQPDIDRYLNKNELSQNLLNFFKGARQEGKNIQATILMLLQAAKINSSPIICIDSSKEKTNEYFYKSNNGNYYLRGKTRDEDMFTMIHSFHSYKSLIIGGSYHLKKEHHLSTKQTSLGLLLTKQYRDTFYSICLWKIEKEDYHFLSNQPYLCFNCRYQEPKILTTLFQKHHYSNYSENGQLYFDGYIVHK